MPQPNPTFRSELAVEAAALRTFARRLVQEDDADDLAQDAIVAALSQSERPRSLSAWLRQVLRNEHRERVRSLLRRRSREARTHVPEAPAVPSDAAAQAEILGAVREVVHALDEPYREVLQARFFEDRSAADIARAEGCPAATVRWRVQEGLRLTRRKLDERFDGRSQWLGALVVFAGLPAVPASTAMAATGEPMNKLMLLKALTGTAAIAATATIAYHVTAPDAAAHNPPTVSARVADPLGSGPPLRAASPATPGAPATIATPASPAGPASDPPGAPPDDPGPGCGAGSDDPFGTGCPGSPADAMAPRLMPALAECLGAENVEAIDDALPAGALVDLSLRIGNDPDLGKVVEEITVDRTEGIDDPQGLGACLTDALANVVVEIVGAPEGTTVVKIAVRGDGADPAAMPVVDSSSFTAEAGARDPMDAISELHLPRRGSERPVVQIVECAEFDCPFCEKARTTIDRIVADFGDQVAVHWMHNPLPFHPGADLAARAAFAAGAQGKFWEMHDLLFDEPGARAQADMLRHAHTLGLDERRFAADLDAPETRTALDAQKATCLDNGAKGTPSFFIEGDLIVGARPYEDFRTVIEDELAD